MRRTVYFGRDCSNTPSATGGLGADVVLEAAGTPEGMAAAVDAVRVGGTVVFAGLPPRRMPFPSRRSA